MPSFRTIPRKLLALPILALTLWFLTSSYWVPSKDGRWIEDLSEEADFDRYEGHPHHPPPLFDHHAPSQLDDDLESLEEEFKVPVPQHRPPPPPQTHHEKPEVPPNTVPDENFRKPAPIPNSDNVMPLVPPAPPSQGHQPSNDDEEENEFVEGRDFHLKPLPLDFPDPAMLPKPSDFPTFLKKGRSPPSPPAQPRFTQFPTKSENPEMYNMFKDDPRAGEPVRVVNPPPLNREALLQDAFVTEYDVLEPIELSPFPDEKKPRKKMPKIQHDFKADRAKETKEEAQMKEDRRNVVKGAFLHAWEGYKKSGAWGSDEVKPVSGASSSPFLGWGATVIDSLATLLILGLKEEYALARTHLHAVDFGIVNGVPWKNGEINDHGGYEQIHCFETNIRYLGGLLGAYDISGDPLVKTRVQEVGAMLVQMFNTTSGVPMSRITPAKPLEIYGGHHIQLAEAGTIFLEMTRLSQITGNNTYFHLAHRGVKYLARLSERGPQSPLLPLTFDTERYKGTKNVGTFGFGAMGDSWYEYLIKEYLLLGGKEELYGSLYGASIDKAYEKLIQNVTVIPYADGRPRPLMIIGESVNGYVRSTMEHLTCFAGAMLGLGAKLLDRPKDMETAKQITQTCYHLGAASATGLQAERTDFFLPTDDEALSGLGLSSNGDIMEIIPDFNTENPNMAQYRHMVNNQPGVKGGVNYYLSRPETIESIFYMYRLTGDKRYQDQGWRYFTDWINKTQTDYGFSSVADVRVNPPAFTDNMESFVFAETFKYHYLLHCDPDFISLDDYVLNTESHPFLLNNVLPGSSNLWDPQLGKELDRSRVPMGEGSDSQKWAVYNLHLRMKDRLAREKERAETRLKAAEKAKLEQELKKIKAEEEEAARLREANEAADEEEEEVLVQTSTVEESLPGAEFGGFVELDE